MSKLANLFSGYNDMRKSQGVLLQGFEDNAASLKTEMTDLQSKIRRGQINMRAMMNQGSPDLTAKDSLEERLEEMRYRLDDLKEKLLDSGASVGEVKNTIQNANAGLSAAIGIPAIGAFSYGNDALRDPS
jgi:chromosome segregation ATPase